MNDDAQYGEMIQRVWTHIVPIAFLVAAVGLLGSAAYQTITGQPGLGLMEPVVGAFLAVVYLILGGVYEWSIRARERNERHYERQKKLLQEMSEE